MRLARHRTAAVLGTRHESAAVRPVGRFRSLLPGSVLAVAGLYVCAGMVAGAAEAGAANAAAPGRAVFEQAKCSRCHGVQSLEIEAQMQPPMRGPTLDRIDTKRTKEWLTSYLEGKEEQKGKTHLFKWRGEKKELTVLVDWLLELQEKSKP